MISTRRVTLAVTLLVTIATSLPANPHCPPPPSAPCQYGQFIHSRCGLQCLKVPLHQIDLFQQKRNESRCSDQSMPRVLAMYAEAVATTTALAGRDSLVQIATGGHSFAPPKSVEEWQFSLRTPPVEPVRPVVFETSWATAAQVLPSEA